MRKGISFTLTIIVAAVLLLTAALTLITVFGSQITSFVGVGEGTVSSAQVETRCNQIKDRIQTGICESGGGSYYSADNEFKGSNTQISVIVDTENGQANCVDQGLIPNSCPVQGSGN